MELKSRNYGPHLYMLRISNMALEQLLMSCLRGMPRDNHYVYQLMLRTWLDPKVVWSLIYSLSWTQRAVANEGRKAGRQAGVWNPGKDFVLLLTSRCAQTNPPFLLYLLCYPRPYLDEHVEQQCLACIAARRVIGLHAIVSQVGLGICESTGKKRRERES